MKLLEDVWLLREQFLTCQAMLAKLGINHQRNLTSTTEFTQSNILLSTHMKHL